MTRIRNLTVFCGANKGTSPRYANLAHALGDALARRGIGLVYGGGNVGLMGVLADGALSRGGTVIGVIPRLLAEAELAHRGSTELHIVESMHDRKALMTARCDAFLALPGGLGTMDEIFEALTWKQLGIHGKPCYLLNHRGFYDSLVFQLDRFVDEGFLKQENRSLLTVCESLGELFAHIDPSPAGTESFFHITSQDDWLAAFDAGSYRADSLATQGFIHMSTRSQVVEVANRLFRGRTDLLVLEIDASRIAARVVRENLEGGQELYPHCYGPLNLDAVVAALPYFPDSSGRFGDPLVLSRSHA